MREIILGLVKLNNGISMTALALKVMEYVSPAKFDLETFFQEIHNLVQLKKLIEINFSHEDDIIIRSSSMSNITRSVYFKEGTQFLNVERTNVSCSSEDKLVRKSKTD